LTSCSSERGSPACLNKRKLGRCTRMTDIVVAIDGSKHSEKIVDTAIGLAKSMSAKLVLAYAAPKLSVPDQYLDAIKADEPDLEDYYEEFSDRMLGDLDKRVKEQKVPVDKVYGEGNPAEFVIETAKARKASMIVVGMHGLHRLGKVRALGSTSRRIIENSPVPVVTVP